MFTESGVSESSEHIRRLMTNCDVTMMYMTSQ